MFVAANIISYCNGQSQTINETVRDIHCTSTYIKVFITDTSYNCVPYQT